MMKLIPISAGSFHCDGGALFGVIPKKLWSKFYLADKNNFTKLSLRCLMVDSGERKILIETGIGNHYSERYFQNNGYIPGNYLEDSLFKNGYSLDEITDVFFTHLHWDHCTGAVMNTSGKLQLTFPHAMHWCSKTQWEHSKISNAREKAAYNTEVLNFINDSGKLSLVENEGNLFPGFDLKFFNGHTPGQMIPFIRYNEATVVYTSDLIPTTANVPLLWLAAYDLYPVKAMEEKEKFLNQVSDKDFVLFFEHDFYTECATVTRSDKGFRVKNTFNLNNL